MTADGSLFVHLDTREVHYVKVALDTLLGRESFMNEIVWAYDFGGRPKTRWPKKHDSILWYAKGPRKNTSSTSTPSIASLTWRPISSARKKPARGKTPTDVWWQTIVPTNGHERTGYATQKPLAVLERIVRVHTRPGATVLDFFAGSGTTGDAAARHGRGFVLIDESRDAVRVMAERLARYEPELVGFDAAPPSVTPRVGRRAR